ncbi:hypothetical protein N7U66_13875 [Lacinutrix neustonica]|uniref:Uncharacterized protein n=1 Tax=Lacinutrix neustonica TaxID=2980107 RepID=A0A9E8MTK1_9FLAO|nr:hypothetical protein [Lacinutrix neustonica]WAC01213.1 hypothetical protein N7U66_13875 [Lacinutrix neustonica]
MKNEKRALLITDGETLFNVGLSNGLLVGFDIKYIKNNIKA